MTTTTTGTSRSERVNRPARLDRELDTMRMKEIGLSGAAVYIIGSFLLWLDTLGQTMTGLEEGTGWFTLAFGVVFALSMFIESLRKHYTLLAIAPLLLVTDQLFEIADKSTGGFGDLGVGLWMAVIGGIVVLIRSQRFKAGAELVEEAVKPSRP